MCSTSVGGFMATRSSVMEIAGNSNTIKSAKAMTTPHSSFAREERADRNQQTTSNSEIEAQTRLRRISTPVSIRHACEGKVTAFAQDEDERRRNSTPTCRLLWLA